MRRGWIHRTILTGSPPTVGLFSQSRSRDGWSCTRHVKVVYNPSPSLKKSFKNHSCLNHVTPVPIPAWLHCWLWSVVQTLWGRLRDGGFTIPFIKGMQNYFKYVSTITQTDENIPLSMTAKDCALAILINQMNGIISALLLLICS